MNNVRTLCVKAKKFARRVKDPAGVLNADVRFGTLATMREVDLDKGHSAQDPQLQFQKGSRQALKELARQRGMNLHQSGRTGRLRNIDGGLQEWEAFELVYLEIPFSAETCRALAQIRWPTMMVLSDWLVNGKPITHKNYLRWQSLQNVKFLPMTIGKRGLQFWIYQPTNERIESSIKLFDYMVSTVITQKGAEPGLRADRLVDWAVTVEAILHLDQAFLLMNSNSRITDSLKRAELTDLRRHMTTWRFASGLHVPDLLSRVRGHLAGTGGNDCLVAS